MLGLGWGEIAIVAVVVLLVVGPDRLPQFARKAGQLYAQLRRTADEMRSALTLEADRQDADERFQKLQERRARAEAERKAAEAASPGVANQEPDLPGVADEPAAPEADDELDALMNDPMGPYAAGRPIEDVAKAWRESQLVASEAGAAALAAKRDGAGAQTPVPAQPAPGNQPDDDGPPAGVTAQEWSELPPKIREMLRGRTP
jgi:Tat protein translocase TatB subunit